MNKTLIAFALMTVLVATSSEWNYNSNGSDWDDHSATDSVCGSGTKQSPINIVTEDLSCSTTRSIEVSWNDNDETTVLDSPESDHDAHTIQLNLEISTIAITDSTLNGEDIDFVSSQFHLHAPSEHTVDGQSFEAELHIVHTATDNSGTDLLNHAVLGLFFSTDSQYAPEDDDDQFFHRFDLSDLLANVSFNSNEDMKDLVQGGDALFYSYDGSLTTPPCTEQVHWNIRRTPLYITEDQLEYITAHFSDNEDFAGGKGNNRQTMPLEDRNVSYITYNGANCEEPDSEESSQIQTYFMALSALCMIVFYL